jgi:hypothetical protein
MEAASRVVGNPDVENSVSKYASVSEDCRFVGAWLTSSSNSYIWIWLPRQPDFLPHIHESSYVALVRPAEGQSGVTLNGTTQWHD